MKLPEVKNRLKQQKKVSFQLPYGELVPNRFHLTELGRISKNFIDCRGMGDKEEVASFQLWNANDYDYWWHPEKLANIMEVPEKILKMGDLEIEVEYQADTIGKFGLDFDGIHFLLTTKWTACLA